jgi:hypothetical protein
MPLLEVIGIFSALCALVAFMGIQYDKLSDTSIIYDLLNLASGLGLVFYAYVHGTVPFLITNSVWAIVSGIDVIRFVMGKRRLIKRRK